MEVFMRKQSEGKIFVVINATIMIVVCILTLYPFINTAAISLNNGVDAARGGIYLWPRVFSLKSYKVILSDNSILNAGFISVCKTVLGIGLTVLFTGVFAYGLSKKYLIGRKFYLIICLFTMFFYGGVIPNYLVYRDLHLTNNFLVYILPNIINVWYMILMKTYFQQLPKEIEESAKIDGCSLLKMFFVIIVPVSLPIIATICIFVGVEQWNAWFDAYLFISDEKLYPLQTYLYRILAFAQVREQSGIESQLIDRMAASELTIKCATVIVTTLPIVFIYSIFQKYFTKGIMIGAIKG